MNTVDLWNDLLSEQNIISREEIEYEIALNDDILALREHYIWGLFGDNSEHNKECLQALYYGVVARMWERGV